MTCSKLLLMEEGTVIRDVTHDGFMEPIYLEAVYL